MINFIALVTEWSQENIGHGLNSNRRSLIREPGLTSSSRVRIAALNQRLTAFTGTPAIGTLPGMGKHGEKKTHTHIFCAEAAGVLHGIFAFGALTGEEIFCAKDAETQSESFSELEEAVKEERSPDNSKSHASHFLHYEHSISTTKCGIEKL